MMQETRLKFKPRFRHHPFTSFPASSVYPRVGISLYASETNYIDSIYMTKLHGKEPRLVSVLCCTAIPLFVLVLPFRIFHMR